MKMKWAILLLLFGCQKSPQNHQLNVLLESEISSLNPADCYDTICSPIVSTIHESLLQYEYGTKDIKLKPLLASALPEIIDSRIYRFKIKKNVFYHSHPLLPKDRFVIAQDFVNQFKRLAFKPNPSCSKTA